MFRLFPGRSGQASMEYLMIAAFIGILIVPATFIYYSYAAESTEQIDKVQIDRIGRNIVSTAERFYYHGYPSTIIIEEVLPANVLKIETLRDDTSGSYLLVMTTRALKGENNTFSFPTDVMINGTFTERAISPGKKNVRISAGPGNVPFVAISMEEGECKVSNAIVKHDQCSCDLVNPTDRRRCFNGVLIESPPNFCGACTTCQSISGIPIGEGVCAP